MAISQGPILLKAADLKMLQNTFKIRLAKTLLMEIDIL